MSKGTGKKTVSFPVSVWYSETTRLIHLARPTDDGFITTISGDPADARGHPHLYGKLADALRDNGAPAPAAAPRVRAVTGCS